MGPGRGSSVHKTGWGGWKEGEARPGQIRTSILLAGQIAAGSELRSQPSRNRTQKPGMWRCCSLGRAYVPRGQFQAAHLVPPSAELRRAAYTPPPGPGAGQPRHMSLIHNLPFPGTHGGQSPSPGAQGRPKSQLEGPRTRTKPLAHSLMGVLLCPFICSGPALCWTLGTPGRLRPPFPVLMGKHRC